MFTKFPLVDHTCVLPYIYIYLCVCTYIYIYMQRYILLFVMSLFMCICEYFSKLRGKCGLFKGMPFWNYFCSVAGFSGF